jgi:hypothetical protein
MRIFKYKAAIDPSNNYENMFNYTKKGFVIVENDSWTYLDIKDKIKSQILNDFDEDEIVGIEIKEIPKLI